MCGAVYNSAIPDMLIRRIRLAHGLRAIVLLAFVGLGFTTAASAADWSIPEQHLAHKIVVVTADGAMIGGGAVELVEMGLYQTLIASLDAPALAAFPATAGPVGDSGAMQLWW